MAYVAIDPDTIKVGDPITKELLDLIKSDFADHETRLNAVETTSSSIYLFNGDIVLAGIDSNDPTVLYLKIKRDMSINDFSGQIFNKNGIAAGSLTLDLEKSTDTNNANFNSILSATLTFNFATAANYAQATATINGSLNELVTGDVLRVKVLATPTNFGGRILINIGAE